MIESYSKTWFYLVCDECGYYFANEDVSTSIVADYAKKSNWTNPSGDINGDWFCKMCSENKK